MSVFEMNEQHGARTQKATTLRTSLLIAAIAFVGTATGGVANATDLIPLLAPLDPHFVLGLKSTPSTDSTYIDFYNKTSDPVAVNWVNYSSQQVFYADLSPGQSYIQQTYLTHPWVVQDLVTGQDIVGFLPSSTEGAADIVAFEPPAQTLINFEGGTASLPKLLPGGSVSEITGSIGGTNGPTDQFYSFMWAGGIFTATGLVDAPSQTDQYFFTLNGTPTGYTDVLIGGGTIQGTINTYLAPGVYSIGFSTRFNQGDPAFDLQFGTPVQGFSAPEPPLAPLAGIGLITITLLRRRLRQGGA